MKLFIFALLSALAVSAYGELSCADIEKQGENGIRKMFIIEEGATIPKTEMELDNRCNDGKKTIQTSSRLQEMYQIKIVPRSFHIDHSIDR